MEYPIIKIPQRIDEIWKNPLSVLKKPYLPIEPTIPKQPEFSQNISTFFGMLIVLSVFIIMGSVATGNEKLGEIIIVTGIILFISIIIVYQSSLNRKNIEREYLNQLKLYNDKIKKYREDYEIYVKELEDYESKINSLNTTEEIELFKFKSIYNLLVNNRIKIVKVNNPKSGMCENYFKSYLISYFENFIIDNSSISLENYKRESFYNPDFLYYDSDSGLIIDIEIDEPYILENNNPIHYEGVDDKRDEFYQRLGIFIIRFSERQVFKRPECCCKEIAQLINIYFPNRIDFRKFESFEKLEKEKQPDYTEAIKLASENYREQYLKDYPKSFYSL